LLGGTGRGIKCTADEGDEDDGVTLGVSDVFLVLRRLPMMSDNSNLCHGVNVIDGEVQSIINNVHVECQLE
jgi:hypothetical protein